MDNTYGIVLDYKLPANTSFTVTYWANEQTKNNANVDGPALFFDSSQYTDNPKGGYENYHFLSSTPHADDGKFQIKSSGDNNSTGDDKWVEQTDYVFDKTWHFYSYTYNAENKKVTSYLDGKEYAQGEVYGINDDAYVYVGMSPWSKNSKRAFNGYIDDLCIYENILTDEQISEMNNGNLRPYTNKYFKFNNPENDFSYRSAVLNIEHEGEEKNSQPLSLGKTISGQLDIVAEIRNVPADVTINSITLN